MTMIAEFAGGGIRFSYPQNWRLEREENENGWTITVQSPDTAFCTISLREDMPSAEALAEATLAALREEYPDLEAEECVETMAGQPALGHDIRFFSLDLTNTCWTRCFYTAQGTMLFLFQFNDLELDFNEKVLRAISASLALEE
jgi:hypothetical protein